MSSKAEEFDKLVHEVFAPCYPVIAGQIRAKTGISRGVCLDLGCGSGFLGLAIAENSAMELCLLDQDPEMLAICQRNIDARQLDNPIQIQSGDVHNIPLPGDSVQLAVSRGSMFFWEDPIQAFQEIYRVLAPGGAAYIGGGFGTPEIKQQIDQVMEQRSPDWKDHLQERLGPGAPDKYRELLTAAGIKGFEIEYGPTGLWLIFGKAAQ